MKRNFCKTITLFLIIIYLTGPVSVCFSRKISESGIVFNDVKDGVVTIVSGGSHGSGFLVKEDESWQQYPLISLKGVTRVGNVLIYHQSGESLQSGFTN